MFLVDWFYGILASLGLWNKAAKICFLGLDNAGKTTLLNMLRYGDLRQSEPTQQPNSDEFSIGSVNFTAFDLGGASDRSQNLEGLLCQGGCCSLHKVPFLILGNKIDIDYAASEDELRYHLGLTNFTTGKGNENPSDYNARPIEVFMCSIARKMGYGEGFRWLSQYIE
ncbi:hypothetical protein M0R45_021094 [Rubus argutus]|uniref:Uncharacterized protein n=1 Tax=Rubus argutus TaxID=59490 RepID=A0AAW1XC22_RUBAR